MILFRSNLRMSILSAFSGLLFLSFALVGLAFNLAVNQYIKSSAIDQLNDSRLSLTAILAQSMNGLENTDALYPGAIAENDTHRNIFRTNLDAFIIDSEYQFVDQQRMPSAAQSIAKILRSENVSLATLNNRRVKTLERIYYITAANTTLIFNGGSPVYMIYYVDVTDLTRFTASVNLLLLSLVGAIWLMSVGITTFLAGSIARPIRLLGMFADRIGKGDFSPNRLTFRDMEFEILNQSLNHTARQLAQYDNEQKTFFQNVSHELRTPLMSIKCYAEGIQYGLMEPDYASKTILSETDRLTDMVDDLLYVSKIDNITAAHLFETTDLRKVVSECASQQQAMAESKGIAIIFDMDKEPVTVSCIIKHITRAVNNLISNAIRYAETNIAISCVSRGPNAVIIVSDDGPGVDSEAISHVFERFYKGAGGLHGIGLSIVKSVAEQHKGSVTVKNGEKGAVFTVTLPRKT